VKREFTLKLLKLFGKDGLLMIFILNSRQISPLVGELMLPVTNWRMEYGMEKLITIAERFPIII